MKVWTTLTPEKLEDIAAGFRLRIHNIRKDGRAWRFTLKTVGPKHPRRRIGINGRTIPGAVCWHGHRDFFRALYYHDMEAIIKTTLAKYEGAEHFEYTYPESITGLYYGVSMNMLHNACAWECANDSE